jgi:hypothetical protein
MITTILLMIAAFFAGWMKGYNDAFKRYDR